ncbi:S-layer homology domain-containing protein [Lysinibacillus xylanilyticus]|uniref:S-layer homology domain-containing protein n=1 Tax=Lysinibacillus xylanilyticus TaxID=582475 RepID=UPI002B246C49|nr:S-layer homology domain-containing protein [Lysinibacillus xylanilyticus]MEB2301639.1 S-layer homology domain-containing protein [Lysinibacillus xylanilyticus]
MKLKKLFLTAAVLTTTSFGISNLEANAQTFSDLKSNHWAYNSVEQVSKNGLVTGYQDGSFKPSNHVTRAEFATFLSRLFDSKVRKPEAFTDVSETHWAKDAIEEGLALGFILESDYKNNKFEPNKIMTRQEIAKWLANGLIASNAEYGEIASTIQNGKYTLLPIAEMYKGGLNKSEYGNVGLMLGTGIMSGFEDGSFKTTGNTTRAEIATILIRFEEAMKKKPTDFKGLNELVEVATTGTNVFSATKYELWGEGDFATTIGKANKFSRNNAGVGTIERIIFVEGTTLEAALKNSIYAKMFIGKNTRLAPDKDLINMYVETGFTSNLDKTTVEAYTNGIVNSFIVNTGISDKSVVKNYGLTSLDYENWGVFFKKGQKVNFWTESWLDYSQGYSNGFTTDDGSRFGLQRK